MCVAINRDFAHFNCFAFIDFDNHAHLIAVLLGHFGGDFGRHQARFLIHAGKFTFYLFNLGRIIGQALRHTIGF